METIFTETLTGISGVTADLVVWVKWLVGIGIMIAGACFIRGILLGQGHD